MSHFYLHLCDGAGFVEDDEGQDFADLSAARDTAVQSLRDVSADEIRAGAINTRSYIEIEDEHRRHVATVLFTDAIEVLDKVDRQPRPLP